MRKCPSVLWGHIYTHFPYLIYPVAVRRPCLNVFCSVLHTVCSLLKCLKGLHSALTFCSFVPPLSCCPGCHWRKATQRSSGKGRHVLPGWPVRSSLAPSTAIVSIWKMMKAKAKRTSTAPWSGTVVIVRGAVRAPVTESAKEAETALELATGKRGSWLVGHVDSMVCPAIG